MWERVTCEACKKRISNAPQNEQGQPQLDQTYEVGPLADLSMGHAIMFATGGRVALCIARIKNEQIRNS
jgi:hypothetical protein